MSWSLISGPLYSGKLLKTVAVDFWTGEDSPTAGTRDDVAWEDAAASSVNWAGLR